MKECNRWTDVRLARHLDISPAMLAHFRAHRRPVTPCVKIRILRDREYEITATVLMSLLPPTAQEMLRTLYGPRIQELTLSDAAQNPGFELPHEFHIGEPSKHASNRVENQRPIAVQTRPAA